jgi:hypothetical protein
MANVKGCRQKMKEELLKLQEDRSHDPSESPQGCVMPAILAGKPGWAIDSLSIPARIP